jgi:hypothetical protein
MLLDDDDFLFPLVREPRSRWERKGLSPAAERRFNRVAMALVSLFVAGWAYSISAVTPGEAGVPVPMLSDQLTRSPFAADAAPAAAFVMDEVLAQVASDIEPLRGESGAVNVIVQDPGEAVDLPVDSLPAGAALELQPAPGTEGVATRVDQAARPGVWNVMLRMRDALRPTGDVSVISLVPLSAKSKGRIGGYLVGSWPYERGGAPKPVYAPPRGLVQVTPENRGLKVSEHFVLGDFLTKGQTDVWPKYVALSPRLLDKLELTLQELERMGHPVEDVFVISAFRTPSYNEGGGNTSGRASLSRHMYGDAMDIAIDNDRNGRMDDLNGDGRVNVGDARVLAEAADRVEAKYPSLIGGIGVYRPTGAHSGFVHIDTRGFRARW